MEAGTEGVEQQSGTSGAVDALRDKTGNLQATVANALDSGAEAIRARIGEGANTQSPGGGERVSNACEAVANGLERSALWLRENDVSDLGTMIRQQLKDHPGRSALVALAIGVLLGRSSKS